MKKMLSKFIVSISALIIIVGLGGCSSKQTVNDEGKSTNTQEQESSQNNHGESLAGLPSGFPKEIPIYSNAQLIEADNFNGNHYTILYAVDAEYDKVADFYIKAFDLDDSGMGEGVAYYEGIEVDNILINGLTIEDTEDAVNVFITLRDDSQETLSSDSDYYDDTTSSDIITYDNAEEVTLDENYPQEVVPIHPEAKVIGCSIVPGTHSGFLDLILPADDFDDAVSFYADKLGIKEKDSSTTVQEAAEFKGEISNIKFSILISHLQSEGNDTYIQITVNEK